MTPQNNLQKPTDASDLESALLRVALANIAQRASKRRGDLFLGALAVALFATVASIPWVILFAAWPDLGQ